MPIDPNDPASGISVRTYLASTALSGMLARNTGFSGVDAAELVKAVDLVIAELNKGSLGSIGSTGSMGAASSTGKKTLDLGGTPNVDVRR